MECIKGVIYNPFWSDFINSVDTLFKTDIITHMDIIHETPIWFNTNLRIEFLKTWFDKGVRTITDIVDSFGKPMELQKFQYLFQIKTNFLENGSVCIKIKSFLKYTEKEVGGGPHHSLPQQRSRLYLAYRCQCNRNWCSIVTGTRRGGTIHSLCQS